MIKTILVVLKTTGYEYYKLKDDVFEQFDEKRKEALEKSHKNQKLFEKKFKDLLTQMKFAVTYITDSEIEEFDTSKKFDLVIPFGGDGTFLNTAQHFSKFLLMGVNSDMNEDPSKGSIGALTSVNEDDLATALNRLKRGEYEVEKWKQLYAKINGKRLPDMAINDIYFGTLEAYKTTHFELFWNGKIEVFRGSSGIVFSTGMGSTSWFRNLGGAPFANDLPIFGFAVRDPQLARNPNFIRGIVDGDEELIVKPLRGGYIISFDSKDSVHTLGEMDELEIGLSHRNPVRVVRFD